MVEESQSRHHKSRKSSKSTDKSSKTSKHLEDKSPTLTRHSRSSISKSRKHINKSPKRHHRDLKSEARRKSKEKHYEKEKIKKSPHSSSNKTISDSQHKIDQTKGAEKPRSSKNDKSTEKTKTHSKLITEQSLWIPQHPPKGISSSHTVSSSSKTHNDNTKSSTISYQKKIKINPGKHEVSKSVLSSEKVQNETKVENSKYLKSKSSKSTHNDTNQSDSSKKTTIHIKQTNSIKISPPMPVKKPSRWDMEIKVDTSKSDSQKIKPDSSKSFSLGNLVLQPNKSVKVSKETSSLAKSSKVKIGVDTSKLFSTEKLEPSLKVISESKTFSTQSKSRDPAIHSEKKETISVPLKAKESLINVPKKETYTVTVKSKEFMNKVEKKETIIQCGFISVPDTSKSLNELVVINNEVPDLGNSFSCTVKPVETIHAMPLRTLTADISTSNKLSSKRSAQIPESSVTNNIVTRKLSDQQKPENYILFDTSIPSTESFVNTFPTEITITNPAEKSIVSGLKMSEKIHLKPFSLSKRVSTQVENVNTDRPVSLKGDTIIIPSTVFSENVPTMEIEKKKKSSSKHSDDVQKNKDASKSSSKHSKKHHKDRKSSKHKKDSKRRRKTRRNSSERSSSSASSASSNGSRHRIQKRSHRYGRYSSSKREGNALGSFFDPNIARELLIGSSATNYSETNENLIEDSSQNDATIQNQQATDQQSSQKQPSIIQINKHNMMMNDTRDRWSVIDRQAALFESSNTDSSLEISCDPLESKVCEYMTMPIIDSPRRFKDLLNQSTIDKLMFGGDKRSSGSQVADCDKKWRRKLLFDMPFTFLTSK